MDQRPGTTATETSARTSSWTPQEVLDVLRRHDSGWGAPVTVWYVVVDELEDDHARLTVDPWPDVDAVGRLRFPPDAGTHTVTLDPTVFHDVVASERLAVADDEDAARRALRIGDAFAVWSEDGAGIERLAALDEARHQPAESVVEDLRVVDVTASARLVTHAAVEAAAAGMVAPQVAQVMERVDVDDGGAEEADDLPGPFPTP